MATVKLFGNLRQVVGKRQVTIGGSSVGEVVTALCEAYPEIVKLILDNGSIRQYYKIMVNGHDIQLGEGLDTAVTEADHVSIFPPIAGGGKEAINLAAIDIGAESGRVMFASYLADQLTIEEIYRFRNGPVRIKDHLHWDILHIYSEIKKGLLLCAGKEHISSLGIDTWGVDFALLDRQGALIGNPYHYRDPRTDGLMEVAFELITRQEIFEQTGIQFMQLNSLFQLLAMKGTPELEAAGTFLTIPDLLNYWLCGVKGCEFTNATTTQLYDQRKGDWAFDLIERMGLPSEIFPSIFPSGTVLGPVLPALFEGTPINGVSVIAPACHDTGSAVAAIPVSNENFGYISSGTWSLVGVEVEAPVITSQSLAYNLTNEGGVSGTVRLLKNVMGLWLIQEVRRIWAWQGDQYSYNDLIKMAESATPWGYLIDPDYYKFLHPANIEDEIINYCSLTQQKTPVNRNQLVRGIFESLALKYRYVFDNIEIIRGVPIEIIYIIGGGSQNALLCQLTADATGKHVIAGPVEATAIGNVLMQGIASSYLVSIDEGRKLVARSFQLKHFEPHHHHEWDKAYLLMKNLIDLNS